MIEMCFRSRRYKMNHKKNRKHLDNSSSKKEKKVLTQFPYFPTTTSTHQQTELTEENDGNFYPSSSAVKR